MAVNPGNVRLYNLSLAGDASNCGAENARTIPPGGAVKCHLRKNISATQLTAAGQLQLAFPFTVTPAGLVQSLPSPPKDVWSASLANLIGASPACSACQSCMQATRTFVQNQPTDATTAATAAAFGTFCTQNEALKQSGLCSKVQSAIEASTFGNLGRRAAGLCMGLELCDRGMGAHCTMQVTVGNYSLVAVSTAELDVCSGMPYLRNCVVCCVCSACVQLWAACNTAALTSHSQVSVV